MFKFQFWEGDRSIFFIGCDNIFSVFGNCFISSVQGIRYFQSEFKLSFLCFTSRQRFYCAKLQCVTSCVSVRKYSFIYISNHTGLFSGVCIFCCINCMICDCFIQSTVMIIRDFYIDINRFLCIHISIKLAINLCQFVYIFTGFIYNCIISILIFNSSLRVGDLIKCNASILLVCYFFLNLTQGKIFQRLSCIRERFIRSKFCSFEIELKASTLQFLLSGCRENSLCCCWCECCFSFISIYEIKTVVI